MGNKESKHRSSRFHKSEEAFLMEMKPVFKFLSLSCLLKFIFLNKRMQAAIYDHPSIILFILKKYFNKSSALPPYIQRGFDTLFTQRIKVNVSKMAPTDQEIFTSTLTNIEITKNLLKNEITEESLNSLHVVNKGPYQFRFEKINSKIFPGCLASANGFNEVEYEVEFKSFSSQFMEKFKAKKAVIKVGCFLARRLRARTSGGIKVKVYKEKQILLEKTLHQDEENLPPSPDFKEIFMTISSDEISLDQIDQYSIEFKIYGRNEPDWRVYGEWNGTLFYEMYVRGDLLPDSEDEGK